MSEFVTIFGAQNLLSKVLIEDLTQKSIRVNAIDYCKEPSWFEPFKLGGSQWFHATAYSDVELIKAIKNSNSIFIFPHQSNSTEDIFNEDEINQFLYHLHLLAECSAKESSVQKIVYVSSMIDKNNTLNPLSKFKMDAEQILRNSQKPVISVRTPLIVLPCSFPYEDVLILLKKVPVLIFPTWIEKQVQPLYWKDLCEILVQLHFDRSYTKIHRNINLPGPDLISYKRFLEIILRKLKTNKKIYVYNFMSLKLWYLSLSFFSGKHIRRVISFITSWNQDAVTFASDWKQKKSWWGVEDAIKDSLLSNNKNVKTQFYSTNYIKEIKNDYVLKTSSVSNLKSKEVVLEFFYWLQNFLLNLIRVEIKDDIIRIYFSQKLFLMQELRLIILTHNKISFECYSSNTDKGIKNKCILSVELCCIKNTNHAFFFFHSNTKISNFKKGILRFLMRRFNKYLEW